MEGEIFFLMFCLALSLDQWAVNSHNNNNNNKNHNNSDDDHNNDGHILKNISSTLETIIHSHHTHTGGV